MTQLHTNKLIKPARRLVLTLAAPLLWIALLTPNVYANESVLAVKASINFNSIEYFHRHSGKVQHEFTPNGQTDLANWTDMLTVVTYNGASDEDKLSVRAKALLGTYQKSGGKVLRAVSSPATNERPAEHFIAAIFASPEFIEFVHLRMRLSETLEPTVGIAIVHSHRIYGKGVGDDMSEWAKEHALTLEQSLLTADVAQSAEAALNKLRQ